MASKVEICNRALILLGQSRIMSESDDSPRARVCFQEFNNALEATLRSYPWPFAMRRKKLARKQDTPAFGYNYYYELPEDCCRIINVYLGSYNAQYIQDYNSSYAYLEQPAYQIEGHAIATNAASVSIRYVTKAIIPGKLDELTTRVVVLNLAVILSVTLTENMELKQLLYSELQAAIAQARNTWATEDYPQIPTEGPWLTRR